MNSITGINVTNFFDDWVLQPGYLGFEVDSFNVVPSGPNFDVTVYSKQKMRMATHLATGVPMEISFRDDLGNSFVSTTSLSGSSQSFTINGVPFNPAIAFFNEAEKISEAVTAHQQLITTTGSKSFANANFTFNVVGIADTIWARVEHHWVAADNFSPANIYYSISPDRFWRVNLLGDVSNFYSKATLAFNGSTTGAGDLDNGLVALLPGATYHDDSLKLFYRKDASQNWQLATNCTYMYGGLTDKSGNVTVDSLKAGDYAWGIRILGVNVSENKRKQKFEIYPNPASTQVTVELKSNVSGKRSVILTDVQGNKIRTVDLSNPITTIELNGVSRGTYLANLVQDGQIIESRKLILK